MHSETPAREGWPVEPPGGTEVGRKGRFSVAIKTESPPARQGTKADPDNPILKETKAEYTGLQ